MRGADLQPVAGSEVQTLPARPEPDSLTMATASASRAYGITVTTGPNPARRARSRPVPPRPGPWARSSTRAPAPRGGGRPRRPPRPARPGGPRTTPPGSGARGCSHGPIVVSGAAGSPMTPACASAARLASASGIPGCGASTREAAERASQASANASWPRAADVAARSASSSAIAADRPPSSRLTDLNVSLQATAIRRPRTGDAGERDLVHPRDAGRRLGHLVRAGNQVEHARREVSHLDRLGHDVGAQRGLRRGLEDHRAPRGQGRGQLGERDGQRVSARRDHGGHAQPARAGPWCAHGS